MPDLVSALNNLFQPSVDEKAIKICLNGAWSMGRSKISCVHVPGRVYESMYEDLLALHGAKRLYEAGLLAEISLQADRTAAESQPASGDDCACPPDTDYFQKLGQWINATLAHAAKTERRFKLISARSEGYSILAWQLIPSSGKKSAP